MIASRVLPLLIACCLLALSVVVASAQDQPLRELAIAFVDRSGDGFYQAAPAYAGLYRPEHFSPFPAAELAIKDGAAAARARGLKLLLLRKSLAAEEDAAAALRLLAQSNAVLAAIIDLPPADMVQLA